MLDYHPMSKAKHGPEYSDEREWAIILEDLRSQFRDFGEGLAYVREDLTDVRDRVIHLEEDMKLVKAIIPTLATKAALNELKIDVVGIKKILPTLATRAEVAEIKAILPTLATKDEVAKIHSILPTLATKDEVAKIHSILPTLATKADVERLENRLVTLEANR